MIPSDGELPHETPLPLRIEKSVYGGDGLTHRPTGEVAFIPFVLPRELISFSPAGETTVLEASPARTAPRCVHFGTCGGCQYQMADYSTQLAIKRDILHETLLRAGVEGLPETRVWPSPEPYGYRNRIRLRVRAVEGAIQLGYSVRGTKQFLPIRMCPIAAPVLWQTAEALLATAEQEAHAWLLAASEVEILCDPQGAAVQVHLLCPGAAPKQKDSFARFGKQFKERQPALVSMMASALHPASGRAGQSLAAWGGNGILYGVGDEKFWLVPGTFFQVNRWLLPRMIELVCGERQGPLAWDLYAGAGLFSRQLAKQFARVVAVEANPAAIHELKRGLRAGVDQVEGMTTLRFLEGAVLQRNRPSLVVLDPPRAGVGLEACALLLRLQPREIVYVSCDPTTLARDAAQLTEHGYSIAELHLLDLFPQTYHLETVMVLHHRGMTA